MSAPRFFPLASLGLVAMLSVGFSASDAFAASAGCFLAPARLSDEKIDAFISAPDQLLSSNPMGGVTLSMAVRDLAGSSSDVLPKLIQIMPSASTPQKASIGAGLARVAKACQKTTPEYVQQIQALVASSNVPELMTAFVAALEEIQTAALGAGGAAAAAAGIGSTGTPGTVNGGSDNGDVSVSNAGQIISAGRTVPAFAAGRSNRTFGGGSTPVSPTT